jgi:hypothetical protein
MNVQLASSRAFLTILLATPEAISATVATLRSFYWILVNQGQVGPSIVLLYRSIHHL